MNADRRRPDRRSWLEWPGLESYALRLAVMNFIVWLALFVLAFGAVFTWMSEGGWIGWGMTLGLCAWSGFFAGLVGYYSASLQVRKMLLLGVVQPTAAEWQRLAGAPVAWRLWGPALGWALSSAALQSLVMLLLSSLGEGLGYPAGPYLFYTALLPAASLALVCRLAAVREGENFIRLVLSGRRPAVSAGGYLLWHSVLPYALVSMAVGVVTAGARFSPQWRTGVTVTPVELAEHLGLTVLLVGLLLPPLARLKVRVERLGPLEISIRRRPRLAAAYHWWLVPLPAAAVWALLRWVPLPPLPAPWAVAVKGLLCLLTASGFCLLAARQALFEEPHPYFALSLRLHRRWREFLEELDQLAGRAV